MAKPIKTRTIVSTAFLEATEVPTIALPDKLRGLKACLIEAVERDCRKFAKFVDQWKDQKLFEHFSPTWEEFVTTHLEKPVEWIELMVTGVAILDQIEPGIPQTADKAVEIAAANLHGGSSGGVRKKTRNKASQAAMLRSQGLTQKEVGEIVGVSRSRVSELESIVGNERDNIPLISDNKPTPSNHRGTSKTHTIARLKRDGHADLAHQVESGQLPAAAARRQAGYPGADRKVFSVGTKTNPQDFALRLADELPREFLTELTAALNELVLRGGS